MNRTGTASTTKSAHFGMTKDGSARGAYGGRPGTGRFGGFKGGGNRSFRPKSAGGGGRKKMPSFDPSRFINTNPVSLNEEVYIPKHRFDSFGLNPKLSDVINGMGFVTPSPIQDQVIPEILVGKDVVGLAETGTGKTAAFLVPLINENIKDPRRQTIILAPTRELAIQIEDELHRLSKGMGFTSVVCVGGVSIGPQIKALRRPNQFIIGTPGRVMDLLRQKRLATRDIKNVVLDEADRMLDMGFINDMRTILATIPKERRTLFFSATMPEDARKIIKDFLRDPVIISVKKKDVVSTIAQDVVPYEHHTKFDTLLSLLSKPKCKRVLIFGSMKHSVEKLAKLLTTSGVSSESIHGNKNHTQRQRALLSFKQGRVRVLVATDVAARGIHVEDITHVINYDLPNTFENYVHRIGRTGRATKKGIALSFVPRAH